MGSPGARAPVGSWRSCQVLCLVVVGLESLAELAKHTAVVSSSGRRSPAASWLTQAACVSSIAWYLARPTASPLL
jgi:hypothetical protein